ncbi:MAG: TfoX/Sxy family DNA transformation protein [Pseudomonadales bacterium]|nr:TfoX/Sxy family DNA transformation protein [Pseudomonadales bacterium]
MTNIAPAQIKDLKGLGPKSAAAINAIGITTVAEFMHTDAFVMYAQLKQLHSTASLNFLYAIIGAQENQHWQHIAKTQKTEILMRLDDMGLAPK